ncbi:flagellar hook capping FlgD N-terminal domain-containing protein [Enterobacteriaceae bacterium LUAb1]
MMSVAGINTYASASRTLEEEKLPEAQGNSNANSVSDMFMQLLLAQIQHQDPTNPTNSTEYVNQLSQMANMESMANMTHMMSSVGVLVDNMQVLSTASLVGKQVMVKTNGVELDDQPVEGRLTLQNAASSVKLHVKDASGNETVIDLGEQGKGDVDFTIDPAKLGLAPGKYTLNVVTDTGENAISTEVAGTVNTVRIDSSGTIMVNVPGIGDVPYHMISQYGLPEEGTPAVTLFS